MSLFTKEINNRDDWDKMLGSISVFTPLVEHIMNKTNLPLAKIEKALHGTNAVFKTGNYIVKIYAPNLSGIDDFTEFNNELFGTNRANKLGVPAPKVIADGFIDDKYCFAYMVTEYINGIGLDEVFKMASDCEKVAIARKLRTITDKMNIPCEPFNSINVFDDKGRYPCWDKYPERFKMERLEYIKSCDYGKNVFVHGDLGRDNILLTSQGELYIIDFGDAVLAPKAYEHVLLVLDFNFDPALRQGYFYDYISDAFVQMCFDGLLIHEYAIEYVEEHIGDADEFHSLEDLRNWLKQKIELCQYR